MVHVDLFDMVTHHTFNLKNQMPLTKREIDALLKDLLKYKDELKWTEADIERIKKAGKKEDVEWLEKRKAEAQKRRDVIEKVIVSRFPQKFGGKRAEKREKEVVPKEVVVPKEEPAIIEVPKSVLERINSGIEAQTAYFSSYEGIAKEQLEAFKTIRDIEEEDKALRENVSEITYPAGGGEKVIPVGMTVLDLWTGDVSLGDGSEDKLSDSLIALNGLYVRSLYIDCNKKFTVQLDGKSTHTIAADDFFSRKGIQCQRVFIDVDESTKLKFWASTNPDATIEEMRNVVVTGVETPLASRQAYWYYRVSSDLPADSIGTLTISAIATNTRFVLNSLIISCEKSCIQILGFTIVVPDKTVYWRERRYDSQGEFNFKDTILNTGEYLQLRFYNDTNETLTFHLEVLGLVETI